MQQDLQLAGLSQGTQEAYLRTVRQLAAHFKTSPDQLSEAQLREYLLFLKNDKQFAASTLRLAYCGIKFFYTRTVPRDWRILKSLRIPKQKTLPDVLSIDEVQRLIEANPPTAPQVHPSAHPAAQLRHPFAGSRSQLAADPTVSGPPLVTDHVDLPAPHVAGTGTGPRRNRQAALFEASSEALKKLAADPARLGSRRCGFFGVLHTWGRALDYHPHVHYVVPGGGLSQDGSQWLASRSDFFLPVRALSVLFRAKFREALKTAGLYHQVDPQVWRQDWVVHSRPAGDGRASLKYLAPYVFRVAISDRRWPMASCLCCCVSRNKHRSVCPGSAVPAVAACCD
jgi:hypothetical protein